MKDSVLVDVKLKRFIKDMLEVSEKAYLLRFADIEDAFWFNDTIEVQEFLNIQARERFFDKSLRKGYFDYVNENGDTLRYNIESVNRGKLQVKSDMVITV